MHLERYVPCERLASARQRSLPVEAERTATETFLGYQVVQHMIIGMIFAGTLDRHPALQLVSVENDAGWAAHLIERMDYVQAKARSRNLLTDQHNEQIPSHYWRNNVQYTFMRDRTAILSRDIIGVDRLLWSSDFPHGDSTWPDSMKVSAPRLSSSRGRSMRRQRERLTATPPPRYRRRRRGDR